MATTTTSPAPFHGADHPHANKRKREASSDESDPPIVSQSRSRHMQMQKDLLEVLERHDTTPSFLRHTFGAARSVASDERSQKKTKLSDASNGHSSIASKLTNTSYTSLQHITADAARVSEELVSSIRNNVAERHGLSAGRPSVDELKQMHRIQQLEMLVKEIIDKETQQAGAQDTKLSKDSDLPNGHTADVKALAGNSKAGSVLTLFGNAPTPKQLFSSMQNPSTDRNDIFIKSELPIEEMSLPNGITATKVMPAPTDGLETGPTFEDAFAPPYSLLALDPPKAHKKLSIKDSTVTWEFKDPVQRNRKGGYTVQPLTVGSWLAYGGLDRESSSTREKRKQRDRALSGSASEVQKRPNNASLEEALAKEEEALFRRAYSSFAPTHDNLNAVVPEETKNVVWWNKVGNKRFNDTFAIDPALLDESEPTAASLLPSIEEADPKDEDFSKVIEHLDELAKMKPEPEHIKSKTEVDQVLREISELLETLASHQRIRNATLASAPVARTPISPAPIVASKIGTPDEPSDEELSTYNTLRREIAYLLLKLPPYAVAKLDGDQLADLGVSKLLTFRAKDTKGTLEEDLVTRQAKIAAMATASSIATLARPSSSAGQHYNTTAQRTPAIGQAANTRYGQQYAPPRTPATLPAQFQRSTSNQSYSTPAATAIRPTYSQPNQYTRPGASQPSYGQTNSQQHYPRPQSSATGYSGFNQQYSQTSQTAPRPNYAQQYQQQQHSVSQSRAANAVAYQTNPVAYNRTASPAKGFPAVSMAPSQQQRPMYPAQHPGSGRATPTGYPSQPNTPVNGYQMPRQPQPVAPRPASSTPQPLPSQAPPPTSAQSNGTS